VGIARRSSVPLKMAGAPRRFQVPFVYIRERAVSYDEVSYRIHIVWRFRRIRTGT